jgi:hypothetical protein
MGQREKNGLRPITRVGNGPDYVWVVEGGDQRLQSNYAYNAGSTARIRSPFSGTEKEGVHTMNRR